MRSTIRKRWMNGASSSAQQVARIVGALRKVSGPESEAGWVRWTAPPDWYYEAYAFAPGDAPTVCGLYAGQSVQAALNAGQEEPWTEVFDALEDAGLMMPKSAEE